MVDPYGLPSGLNSGDESWPFESAAFDSGTTTVSRTPAPIIRSSACAQAAGCLLLSNEVSKTGTALTLPFSPRARSVSALESSASIVPGAIADFAPPAAKAVIRIAQD